MDFGSCALCGESLILCRAGARFCSTKCRVYFSRGHRPIPVELRERDRWIRYSSKKVPLRVGGGSASSTDPSTWSTFAEASASSVGVGYGFVLTGDGVGCYDLDHCFVDGKPSAEAIEFVRGVDPFYVEISPSGDGIHAWVHVPRSDGFRRVIGGLNVEFYTHGRYLTVTGKQLRI